MRQRWCSSRPSAAPVSRSDATLHRRCGDDHHRKRMQARTRRCRRVSSGSSCVGVREGEERPRHSTAVTPQQWRTHEATFDPQCSCRRLAPDEQKHTHTHTHTSMHVVTTALRAHSAVDEGNMSGEAYRPLAGLPAQHVQLLRRRQRRVQQRVQQVEALHTTRACSAQLASETHTTAQRATRCHETKLL
jgi:hypothetical protein